MRPLANHSSIIPSSHPPTPHSPAGLPRSPLCHQHVVLSRTHKLLSAYCSHSAVEGHVHVASRIGSHRFFCQGHLLHPTGTNLSAKPESGITSSEKLSVTSPAEPTVSCSAPMVPGRGASRHPSATLSPTSTPYDQIPLDLALLAGMELTPLVPGAHRRRPSLGGHCHKVDAEVRGKG